MRALVFDKSKYDWETSNGFDLVDVPKPELLLSPSLIKEGAGGRSVIIKVFYAGVCGTDKGTWHRQAMKDLLLNSIDTESPLPNPPHQGEGKKNKNSPPPLVGGGREGGNKSYRILGHEFFGEIVEVGKAAAKDYKLKVGDFVTCESHVVCNRCFQCLRGEKQVCTNEKILGISHDGCFAEYIKVPAHIVWKTDTAKIRPEIAAMQEPFGNAVHAASKVDLKDKTIAIFGLGPIGMFLLLVARGMGAKKIIGAEPNPIAAEMARKLGIDYVIALKANSVIPGLTRDPDWIPARASFGRNDNYFHNSEITDEIMKITKGLGVDVSFEMAGFNSSVNNSIFATRRGGEVILFGLKTGDFVFEDYNKLVMKGVTMHCVAGRQIWKTWERTRMLMENAGNGIQEKMFNIILARGEGTILPLKEYTKERFEQMMAEHPKFLIQL